jgi:hypothetical protein
MTREQRIDGAACLAALVCAVTFPHRAGAGTAGHALRPVAPAAPAAVLDWRAWPRP